MAFFGIYAAKNGIKAMARKISLSFLGIKPSQCLWPSFQMVLTGIGDCAYRTLSKSFGKHIRLP